MGWYLDSVGYIINRYGNKYVVNIYKEYDYITLCQCKLALALNNEKSDETLGYIINGNDPDYQEQIDVNIVKSQIYALGDIYDYIDRCGSGCYYKKNLLDKCYSIFIDNKKKIKGKINHYSKNKNINVELKYTKYKQKSNNDEDEENYCITFNNEIKFQNTKIYSKIKIINAEITYIKTVIKSKKSIEVYKLIENNTSRQIEIIKNKLLKRKICPISTHSDSESGSESGLDNSI